MASSVCRAKAKIWPRRVTPSLGQISNAATENSFPFNVKGKMFTETLTQHPRQKGNTALNFIFQNSMFSKDLTAGSRTSIIYLRWDDKF